MKEDRLKLENELLLTKSKAQMINLYLDLLQENERLNKIIEEYSEAEKQREEDEMMDYLIREEEKFNDYSFLED